MLNFSRGDFPAGFEFGVSTSAYQIEGSQSGDCGVSQWDVFAATPGNVVRGEHGGIACDHYHRWSEDFDLVADLGLDAYRFSTSWARIMPEGRGAVNQSGLDYYDRLLDGLLERNIKPYACLYHWELPAPLLDLGGWRNRDVADWFADFTQIVMSRLGDRLAGAATFNEPWCITWLSHFLGHHAPGLRDIRAATRAMHHVLLSHGRAIEVMRSLGMDNLGIILNFEHASPADESLAARAATERYDAIYNRWYLDAIFKKSYPEAALDGLLPYLPEGFEHDFDTIAAPLDWLGINYYTRKLITVEGNGLFPDYKEVAGALAKTAMDWEIYPDGLHYFIMNTYQHYSHDLPIYVTENGMAAVDNIMDGKIIDTDRIAYFTQHLAAVKKAISEGAPVKGYFAWSLLDNYEWSFGYEKRFGLVHVDFESLKRTPKQSYYAFQQALTTHRNED